MEYRCNICNKTYSSYQSLWIHNKKFHNPKTIITNNVPIINQSFNNHLTIISTDKTKQCKYCNKIFSHYNNKWRHEKTCKLNNKIEQLEINNNEINTLKKTINEMKEQFALLLKEKGKVHHKTLQKINNQLNNINNGNITNNTYVKFGDLDYQKVLNNKQIKHILNQQYQSLEESIKQIHFNEELPEYSNIFITNMKDVNNKIKLKILSINDKS